MSDNPFAPPRSRSKSPGVKNTFQEELESKMRDRHRRGLSAEMTESEDELGSDDELMSGFNMTSKGKENKPWQPGSRTSPKDRDRSSPFGRKSPYDSLRGSPSASQEHRKSPYDDLFGRNRSPGPEDDGGQGLMKTMRQPWNPNRSQRTSDDKKPMGTKDMKSKLLGIEEEDKRKPWQPPSLRKHIEDDDDDDINVGINRSMKSSKGRRSPLDLDAISEETPKPTPRSRKHEDTSPRPKPRPRGARQNETDETKPRSRGSTPTSDMFSANRSGRNTPSGKGSGRTTPTGKSREGSPTKDMFGRRTPKEEQEREKKKKSIFDMLDDEPDPKEKKKEKRKSPKLRGDYDSDDDNPYGRKRDSSFGRKSPYEGERITKKSSHEVESNPFARKSPKLHDRGDRYDRDSRHNDDEKYDRYSRTNNRKSPFGEKPRLKDRLHDESDSDDNNPYSRGRQKQRERQHEEVDTTRDRSRERKAKPRPERESSVCRDEVEDPTMGRNPTDETERIARKQPKQQTKEKQLLDQVIDSVNSAQGAGSAFRPINPDKKEQEEEANDKSNVIFSPRILCSCQRNKLQYTIQYSAQLTMTKSRKHKPRPRYVKPMVDTRPVDRPNTAPVDFNSTHNIRENIYQQWYKERQEKAKKAKKEELEREKAKKEKEEKAKQDKILESKASYDAWKEKKEPEVHEKRKKMLKEEKKKQKEEDAKLEKKQDAEKNFKAWKENKDAYLREQARKKKRQEEKKKEAEEEKKEEKEKDSKSAFRSWKERKEQTLEEKKKEEQREKRRQERDTEKEKKQREEEAQRKYESWMAKKEERQRDEKTMRRSQSAQDFHVKPWSPASRTVPFGRS